MNGNEFGQGGVETVVETPVEENKNKKRGGSTDSAATTDFLGLSMSPASIPSVAVLQSSDIFADTSAVTSSIAQNCRASSTLLLQVCLGSSGPMKPISQRAQSKVPLPKSVDIEGRVDISVLKGLIRDDERSGSTVGEVRFGEFGRREEVRPSVVAVDDSSDDGDDDDDDDDDSGLEEDDTEASPIAKPAKKEKGTPAKKEKGKKEKKERKEKMSFKGQSHTGEWERARGRDIGKRALAIIILEILLVLIFALQAKLDGTPELERSIKNNNEKRTNCSTASQPPPTPLSLRYQQSRWQCVLPQWRWGR